MAFDTGVAEPVAGVAGLERTAIAGRGNPVLLGQAELTEAEVIEGDIALGVERLAVGDAELGTGRTDVVKSQPAVDVLAEVDHLAISVESGDRRRRQLLGSSGRRRGRDRQPVDPVIGDDDRSPRTRLDSLILVLAAHEVGGDHRTGRPLPLGPGRDDRLAHVELPEEGDTVAVGVDVLVVADLTAVPAVAEHDGPLVATGPEQAVDVVGLHVEVIPVAREPRGELLAADPLSVKERLVHPVSSGVHPGRDVHGGIVEIERVAQDVRRATELAPWRLRLGLDPSGSPVAGVERRLEPGRRRPLALAEIGDDLHPPLHTCPARHRSGRPWDEDVLVGVAPRCDGSVEVEPTPNLPASAFRQVPTEARGTGADPEHRAAEEFGTETLGRQRHAHPVRGV